MYIFTSQWFSVFKKFEVKLNIVWLINEFNWIKRPDFFFIFSVFIFIKVLEFLMIEKKILSKKIINHITLCHHHHHNDNNNNHHQHHPMKSFPFITERKSLTIILHPCRFEKKNSFSVNFLFIYKEETIFLIPFIHNL